MDTASTDITQYSHDKIEMGSDGIDTEIVITVQCGDAHTGFMYYNSDSLIISINWGHSAAPYIATICALSWYYLSLISLLTLNITC